MARMGPLVKVDRPGKPEGDLPKKETGTINISLSEFMFTNTIE